MFRQVSLTTLVRPLLFLAILFVAMVLYLSERQNAIDRQVNRKSKIYEGRIDTQWECHYTPKLINIKTYYRYRKLSEKAKLRTS